MHMSKLQSTQMLAAIGGVSNVPTLAKRGTGTDAGRNSQRFITVSRGSVNVLFQLIRKGPNQSRVRMVAVEQDGETTARSPDQYAKSENKYPNVDLDPSGAWTVDENGKRDYVFGDDAVLDLREDVKASTEGNAAAFDAFITGLGDEIEEVKADEGDDLGATYAGTPGFPDDEGDDLDMGDVPA